MKYPTLKMRGSPTPNDKLVVCDMCHTARWDTHSTGRQSYYYCCQNRTREATSQEYIEGKLALKEVLEWMFE